jgi:hypothetical protein
MKVTITDARGEQLRCMSHDSPTRSYRLAGVLIAVGVPTLFWSCVIALVSDALDVALGATVLVGAAASIAASTLVGSSLTMASPDNKG